MSEYVLRSVKTAINVGQQVNFVANLPLLGQALAIVAAIVEIVETADNNKKTCVRLRERVLIAQDTIDHVKKEDLETNPALKQYVEVLGEIKKFIEKVSQASKFSRFINSIQVRDEHEGLTNRLDTVMRDLGLNTAMRTKQQIEQDRQTLEADIANIQSYLASVNNGIVGIDSKLSDFVDEIRESVKARDIKPSVLEASRIDPKEISDPTDEDDEGVIRKGSSIKRKLWRYQNVAEKDCGVLGDHALKEIEKDVAILKQLQQCKYIIQLYGSCQRNGRLHLVMEYAAHGNLHDYMERNDDLNWGTRLSIAVDISRGLCFLHEVGILHHDIRSHNILLTERNVAKITNFSTSRTESESSRAITQDMSRVRWTAPEKLQNVDTPYTKRCDVFSFGVVLWEISSGRIPYSEYGHFEAYQKVLANYREKIIPGTPEKYASVLQQSWDENPKKRPTISELFLALKSTADEWSATPHPVVAVAEETTTQESEYNSDDDDLLTLQLTKELVILRPISEGLSAHKSKKYETAWSIFKENADADSPEGIYWVGLYIYRGLAGQKKDLAVAVDHFRRAAEGKVVDAQLRYGSSLMKGEGVSKNTLEGFTYLKSAAEAGSMAAQFNVGDLYYTGRIPEIQKNEKKGKELLKKAALQGHPTAKKMCDELGF